MQEPSILRVLPQIEGRTVEILDVGAGPATWLGKSHPERHLRITPVDPLAADYDRLLRGAGLTPPVRTLPVSGEDLLSAFGSDAFDVVYARNALDHSADPLHIIEQMLAVVRRPGFVILRHLENEGASMQYEELHQWNFAVEDERLHLWNRRSRVDVTGALAASATVRASVAEHGANRWVTAVLERRV